MTDAAQARADLVSSVVGALANCEVQLPGGGRVPGIYTEAEMDQSVMGGMHTQLSRASLDLSPVGLPARLDGQQISLTGEGAGSYRVGLVEPLSSGMLRCRLQA